MKKKEAKELLKKYRMGLCTKSESDLINFWFNSFEDDKSKQGYLDPLIVNEQIGKQIYENVFNKINQTEENLKINQIKDKNIRQKIFIKYEIFLKIAAVILVGIGIAFFFIEHKFTRSKEGETLVDEITSKATLPSVIYLSDGSVVWLKGESRLIYPNNFSGKTREVTLIGEAFFDIAKDPVKSFIIHSPNFTTRVLGTTFNIKAYENNDSQEVVVITGKVAVSLNDVLSNKVKEIVLNPNQKAIYSRKENTFIESKTEELPHLISLLKSKLIFNATPLDDIIKVLNSLHGVNISVAKENMKNCKITADLTNEPLEISIAILSKALNADYNIEGKNILLSGSDCQ